MDKSFLQSKTFWFNVLAIIVTITGTTTFQAALPSGWLVYDAAIVSAGNIVLRFMTTQPITISLPPGSAQPPQASIQDTAKL